MEVIFTCRPKGDRYADDNFLNQGDLIPLICGYRFNFVQSEFIEFNDLDKSRSTKAETSLRTPYWTKLNQ